MGESRLVMRKKKTELLAALAASPRRHRGTSKKRDEPVGDQFHRIKMTEVLVGSREPLKAGYKDLVLWACPKLLTVVPLQLCPSLVNRSYDVM